MTKFLNDTGLGTLISLIKGEINDKKSIYIGTSPSGDASKKDKTATVDTFPTVTENNVTKPKTGTIVGIKFLATNTYKTANNTYTLNVNSTGAYPMYYNNAELATSTSANTLVAGYKNRYCYYIFNGTQWVWLGAGYDSNTTYSSMTQAEVTAGTGTTARIVTPKLLRDNFYTEGEVDEKLPLVVEFTENNNVVTCDTSIADIYAAYSAEREVFGRYNAQGQLNLTLCLSGLVTFSNAFGNTITQVIGFAEGNTDTWTNDSVTLQTYLTFDSTPTLGSSRPVTSEGIKVALNAKQDTLTFDSTPTANSTNPVTSSGIKTAIDSIESDVYIVTCTQTGQNTGTTTATYNDITDATSSGKVVFYGFGGNYYKLGSTSYPIFFAYSCGTNNNIVRLAHYLAAADGHSAGDVVRDYVTFQTALTFDNAPTANSSNPVKSGGVYTALSGKQDTLVSGTNIKTVCGSSILGSGDLQLVADDIYTGYGSVEDALNAKQDKDFIVTVTTTGSGSSVTYSANKTPAECYTAYNAGKKVIFKFNGSDLVLDYAFNSGSNYQLVAHSIYDTNLKERLYTLRYVLHSGTTSLSVSDYYLQSELTFDNTPTANSDNPVKSSGIKTALDAKQDKDFIITLSVNNGVYTADKSFSEVLAAYNAGKTPVVLYYEYICNFVSYDGSDFHFINHPYDELSVLYQATLHYNNTWEYSGLGLQEELIFDNTPTANSTKPVTSSGIKSAIDKAKAYHINLEYDEDEDEVVFATGNYNDVLQAYNDGKYIDIPYGEYVYHLIAQVDGWFNFITYPYDGGGIGLLDLGTDGKWTNTFYDANELLSMDSSPVANSNNPIKSGGVYTALQGKQNTLVSGTNIKTVNSQTLLGSGDILLNAATIGTSPSGNYDGDPIEEVLDEKQDTLVSGTNIKTVNNNSLLGSGNINIEPNEITSITTTESTASGGNNTVTITETSGTTHTFNVKNGIDGQDGQDGADGVSLGEIALVQTTGNATDAVMSQKAVTDYGRKVTAEDLAGTSDWIKTRLTEEGWEFGKYMKSTGSLGSDANYCVTPFIELGNRVGHSLTFRYMYDAWATGYFGCFTSGKVVIGATFIATNSNNSKNTTLSRDDAYYARMTCNPNKISQCYIYDNTTSEYIWKGEDCIFNANNDNRVVDYTTFETSMLAQEIGNDKTIAASQYALKSLDLHPATMFIGTLANYKISNFPILNPCQCDKLSFLIDRRYPSTSWFGSANDTLVTTDFFKFSKDSSNYFTISMSGYQWTIKMYNGGAAKVNKYITATESSPNFAEHVVCCIDFKTAVASLYINGRIAVENSSLANEDLTPYLRVLENVNVTRAEKWGSMGAAIFNDFLTASEVSAIYNSGTYVDWLIRDEYISKSFSADVLPMNALLSTGDGTRSNATETSVDIACTGSNSNAYQRMTIPSYVETKVCEMRLHISMTTGSITFKGFGLNGRWTANITNSSDGTTASSTLTAGNEYDIVARKQAPAGTSGDYFINYSRSADCSFTLSSCTLKQIGAPLICAPQNYNKVSFVQESGDAVPTSCTALYSPYKPRVVNSTGKNPQFTGQIAINPSTMAIYIGVNKTWKQINNS